MVHALKIKEKYASPVLLGKKPFEVRYNDRNYQTGDYIQFSVIDDNGEPVHHILNRIMYKITYVLADYGLQEGFVALAIKKE